ncbi:MAG: LytTR family DNA-binding domain-containing protein [Balneolaceae bacterium]|nr:LytTR family DNA-binding domain-containing protein [Balneolaceae bacterium]
MIVDDEPVAIRVLERHLGYMDRYEVVKTCTDSAEAFRYLSDHRVDLLLLDIEMPELSGLQLFKTLEHPPALILVTAHRDYAVEGFELNAVDYLMKPVSFPRFAEALERFEDMKRQHTATQPDDGLFVTVDRKKKKIFLDEIRYVESLKDYIRIVGDRENVITRETTSDFEERLPNNRFLRIHRSYIINMTRITTVTHDKITLGDTKLPVGRSYKQDVRQALGLE